MTEIDQKDKPSPSVNKQQIVDAFLLARTSEGERLTESAQKSFEIANQMDGKMQSRYDTQKEDHASEGMMKVFLAQRAQELVKGFIEDNEGITAPVGVVAEESVIRLHDHTYNEQGWYFLSKLAGGMTVSVGETTVKGINPTSVLGKKAMGKRVGERITYKVQGEIDDYLENFEVLEIL